MADDDLDVLKAAIVKVGKRESDGTVTAAFGAVYDETVVSE
jgi:hypothetical protein